MAVLNSNLKRFLLIASLLLSACSNLQSTANEVIENSGVGEIAGINDSSSNTSDVASEAQEEGASTQPATSAPSVTEETTENDASAAEATATEEEPPTPTLEPSPTPEPTQTPLPTPEPTPMETPIPEPTPLPVSITSRTADMLLISGGEFEMGADSAQLLEECGLFHESCDEAWFTSAGPIHMIQLAPFYLDANEVTNEAFLEYLNELEDIETGCAGQLCFEAADSRIEIDSDGLYTVDESYFEHPATGATWYGAAAFCTWRDVRLPSEAEWEMAASWDNENNTKYLYPWGDEFDGTALNHCDINCEEQQSSSDFDDGFANTAPVGSYESGLSPIGAYDMGGNVWEWVNDWYDDAYYRDAPESDPLGPEEGEDKVVRGGSWFDTGNFSASAIRFPAPPVESGDSIGFRCAVDAIPADEVLAQAPESETEEETIEEAAEETTEETAEEVTEEAAEETTEETAEEVVEEATAETTEETAEESTEEAAAAEETEETAESTAPVSINCDLNPGVDNGSTYTVGACDWLAKIANKLGVSYHDLLAANPQIADPNLIYPGQVINVPPRNGSTEQPTPPGGSSGPTGPPTQPPSGLGG